MFQGAIEVVGEKEWAGTGLDLATRRTAGKAVFRDPLKSVQKSGQGRLGHQAARLLPSEQNIFGLIDFGCEIVGAAAVGMKPLHQAAVGVDDDFARGAGFDAQDAIRFVNRHLAVVAISGSFFALLP